MIWNARPRFFANACSAANDSAAASAVIAPAVAAALNSAPVLPRWMRSSTSNVIGWSVASRSAAWPPISPCDPTASDISSVSFDACAGSYDRDHHSKRLVEQTERRKDGDRFAKRHVIRRPAASQRRIVHGGEIVEDERGGVDHFDGAGGHDGAIVGATAQLGRQQRQDRAHPLRGRVQRVAHGLLDRIAAVRHQAAQLRFHACLILREEQRDTRHFLVKTSMYW